MSEKTLKFNNVKVNKKEFHKFKQPIDLSLVIVDQIVISDKFKHSDDGFKYFIGYQEGEIVKPLCIILPQMMGYIKYFENGGKNMSFLIKDDSVLNKYNEIWDKIKEKLSIKFHSMPVYDETYIKAKVREFDGKIKTNVLGNRIPKENMHYTCITCITIDSVMGIDKKNYLKIYSFIYLLSANLFIYLKTPSDGTLLGRTPEEVLVVSSFPFQFIFDLHFVVISLLISILLLFHF